MSYKSELNRAMIEISEDSRVVHIGYGLKYGGRAAGSLKDVSDSQIVETPVAENLMLGLAIGMAIEGYIPIVYYERFDFIMNAMDALVNHLDKIVDISKKEYNPKVIIRCVVGGVESPFFTGVTHTQNFYGTLKGLLKNIDVISLEDTDCINSVFKKAMISDRSTIIIEKKDLYAKN